MALVDRRIPKVEDRIRDALNVHGTTLTDIFGIGDIGAATIFVGVGDVHRFPSRGHFAAFNGTAPLDASSGDIHRHRLLVQVTPRTTTTTVTPLGPVIHPDEGPPAPAPTRADRQPA